MERVHFSVMAEEVVTSLVNTDCENPVLIDCTLGEGGHSRLLLEVWKNVRLVGVDADEVMLERARQTLAGYEGRFELHQAYFDEALEGFASDSADAVLMDLGVSMFHFKGRGKGFAFSVDEDLDMRLGPVQRTAADILNGEREVDLARIFFEYGEETRSRVLARAIVRERAQSPILTTDRLKQIIQSTIPPRRGAGHPAARIFQALRIEVNSELFRLERAILAAYRVLKPGGRLGIISFHSLEDRIVKNSFKWLAANCRCPAEVPRCQCEGRPLVVLPFKKPLVPSRAEANQNPASRSAKYRVMVKAGSL